VSVSGDEPGPPRPPPIELELADVPRRNRGGTAPPPGTMAPPAGTLAPLAGTMAPLPGASPLAGGTRARGGGLGLRHVVAVLVLGAVAVGAGMLYQRLTRPDVVAVRSPYRSFIGMTVELPGDGWKRDRRLRKSQSQGPRWMRFEALFRGKHLDDPDDLVMVFRVFAPGAFAARVDLGELRRQAQLMSQALGQLSAITGSPVECVADTAWRTEPAARCHGSATVQGRPYAIGVSIWQPTTEDLVGVFYVSATLDSPDFETIVRSMQ
jgi:hypothetical protein